LRFDLHRHLEGSHSPQALAAVAENFGILNPVFFDPEHRRFRSAAELRETMVMPGPSDDAQVFYGCIQRARLAYVSEIAIGELARRAFLEAARECDGFEMRISLFSMTRTLLENQKVAWRELDPAEFAERARTLLLGVVAARDVAARETSKPMLIRVGFSRTFESEPHYRAMATMLAEHRDAVCGLDVLGIVPGPDREPMPAALRDILDGLRHHIADLTVHAGEFEDFRSVMRTLELKPQAIGHGVRAVHSDETLAKLASDGVTLEVCPCSNRMLIPTSLKALEQHRGCAPLVALQRAKVHCVLGSDDPATLGTNFADEWTQAGEAGANLELLEQDVARRWQQIAPAPRKKR
jgi:adenosine deaminase